MGNPTIKAQNCYLYQNNTLNERTLLATASDGTGNLSLTNDVLYWDELGNPTDIFTPSVGADKVYCACSRDYAYFADGEPDGGDLYKWDIVTGLSNWGIAAPLSAPAIFATSGTTQPWVASTVFSTFGLIIDSNNNIQQLISVNATGTNPNTQFGKTGVGQPAWSQTAGGTTSDGSITWVNSSPIGLWAAGAPYSSINYPSSGTTNAPSAIYDPETNAIYVQGNGGSAPGGRTSGSTRPPFAASPGWKHGDGGTDNQGSNGGCQWYFLCSALTQWQPSTYYSKDAFGQNWVGSVIIEPVDAASAYNTITNTFNQTIYVQLVSVSGTSASSGTAPLWQTTIGNLTNDGQLQWRCMGPKAFVAGGTVIGYTGINTNFTVISDTTNFQVCLTGGVNGGSAPSWATSYGSQTTQGAVVWTEVGAVMTWVASTSWYLPANNFVPPATTASYGGASIEDSNNVIQTVISSGESASTAPAWGAVGNNTTDGAITWYAVEPEPSGAGDVTLLKGRYYYVIFINSVTQGMSDLSPVTALTGAITNGQVYLSNIPISGDPQVDFKIILATTDGGDPTTLYFVAQIPNTQTTYLDDTSELLLPLNNIYQETSSYGNLIGVIGNEPPPLGLFPTLHQGRIWLAKGQYLYFSKALSDMLTSSGIVAGRYEESFPPENSLDVSPGSEIIRGLLSDGYTIYAGTERHIHRVTGSDPTNFSTPNVLFSETGLLTQNVWQIVFREGTPIGSMWMTPDFRVILSDFNTYQDVGKAVQTTLNSINPAAAKSSFANFVGYGAYNFYVLQIPTGVNTACDTALVFDTHLQKWYVWQFADKTTGGIFYITLGGVPRWMFFSADGTIRYVDPTLVVDKQTEIDATNIPTTIQTTWLHLGDATLRKLLNEIEVMTIDTSMTVTIEGAENASDFITPITIVTNASLIPTQFGPLKTFLVGLDSRSRYYRFTFSSTSSVAISKVTDVLLGYYSVNVLPLNRL
jgi:hypothetical protein